MRLRSSGGGVEREPLWENYAWRPIYYHPIVFTKLREYSASEAKIGFLEGKVIRIKELLKKGSCFYIC